MTLAIGTTQLVATQGGGGLGDPIERDPELVAADVAAGLVSAGAALADYGVVVAGRDGLDHTGAVEVDATATARCRAARRRMRLGGREPAPPRPSGGSRFDDVFDVVGDTIACGRCGSVLGPIGRPVAERLLLEERPASTRMPLGFRFTGSERFVLRALHCPHCGRQVDVQIALATDPIVDAAEPLPAGVTP
jgi:N-methylhydantoinase B